MKVFDSANSSETGPMPQVGTLNGNPIATVAGLSTLRVLRETAGIYENTFAKGRRLQQGIREVLDKAEIPAQVIGHDALFDVYFTGDEIYDYRGTLKADKSKTIMLNSLLLERGIFKGETKFYVSTAHSDADIDFTLDAFNSAVGEL